jgi:hypothetical protein
MDTMPKVLLDPDGEILRDTVQLHLEVIVTRLEHQKLIRRGDRGPPFVREINGHIVGGGPVLDLHASAIEICVTLEMVLRIKVDELKSDRWISASLRFGERRDAIAYDRYHRRRIQERLADWFERIGHGYDVFAVARISRPWRRPISAT